MKEQSNINRFSPPDLREFLGRRKQELKGEINSCLIGIIESFNAVEQTASINVAFKKVLKAGNPLDSGAATDKIIEYPMLVRCPVTILNGGGAYITFPITKGDECLVLFCDKDIDGWFSSGAILPPNSERIHDLSDGIAIVGPKSLKNVIIYDPTRLKIFYGNGYITIDSSGKIHLSSPNDIIFDAVKIDVKATDSIDLVGAADAIVRGAEVTLGMPADSTVPYSTEDIRRVWVVTSVVGNAVTLEERRISLSRPPAPITRVVTVQ